MSAESAGSAGKHLSSLRLVCLGYHPWSPMWKRNQSMCAELARQKLVESVVFLNPEVSAVVPPARLLAELRTTRGWSWRRILPGRPEPRIRVQTPVRWLPFRGRWSRVERADRALLAAALRMALGGVSDYVLLVNTVRRESLVLAEMLRARALLTVFDWSDDFSRYPVDAEEQVRVARATETALSRADLVLAVNSQLAKRARRLCPQVVEIINATNMRVRPPGVAPGTGAGLLAASLKRPVLGYAGFINHHRVDLELVVKLARRHPDWTILLIGPVFLGFEERFPDLENLCFHPPVPYTELQDHLNLFDVCLIPHLDNAHTAGNNPIKLYDYLTTGRPIVSTRIAGLEGFEDVVTVTDTHEGFLAAVETAIAEERPAETARRLERARLHHWSIRAQEVARAIQEALDRLPA